MQQAETDAKDALRHTALGAAAARELQRAAEARAQRLEARLQSSIDEAKTLGGTA